MSDPSNQDQLRPGDNTEEPTERLTAAGRPDNIPEEPTERLAVPAQSGSLTEESTERLAVAAQPDNIPEEPTEKIALAGQPGNWPGAQSSGPLDPATSGQPGAPVLLPEQQPTAKLHSLPPVQPIESSSLAAPQAPAPLPPELQSTAKLHAPPVLSPLPPAVPNVTPSIEDFFNQNQPRVPFAVPMPVEKPQPLPVPTLPPVLPTLPAQPARPVPPPRIGADRRFTLTLAAIAAAFLLIGVGILIAGYNAAQSELKPAQAAQAFCRDLKSQNYSAAYALLDTSYQSQVTMTQFVEASHLQDQVDGIIRACPSASGPSIDLSFGSPHEHQSFLITIVRNRPLSGHIALVQENGTWKVEGLQQSLAGTNLGPLLVANTFCQALVAGDYATAYSTLSTRQQSLATEQQFATQFSSALGGPVKLNSCTMDYSTYTIRTGAAAISTTFNLTISTSTGGTLTTNLRTLLSLVQENGAWKVDDFSLQPSAG